MKVKLLIIGLLTLVLTGKTQAQNLNTSPLSRYGVGDIFFQGNIRQLAMGNSGIADYTPFHISPVNPALTGALKPNNVVFEFGLVNRTSLYDNGLATQWNNFTDIRYFYGGFRITRNWHTAFGIMPFSGTGYKLKVNDTATIDGYTTPYSVEYDGNGSINQLFWSNSYTFFRKLTVGAKFNVNFGSFDHQTNIVFNSDSDFTSITVIKDRNIFKKITYDFGIVYQDTIKIKSKPFVNYSLGGIYTNKQDVTSFMTKIALRGVNYNNRNFHDSIFYDTVSTSSFSFPQTYGVGINLKFKQLTFSADYITRKWSDVTIFDDDNFTDSRFIGFGAEYCRDPLSSRYWRTIKYRAGAYNYNSYILFNNKQITTNALTFGMGFPFKSIMLNFGVVIGQKGSIDLGLKENFYEFNFGVSLYDLWFIKRKYL